MNRGKKLRAVVVVFCCGRVVRGIVIVEISPTSIEPVLARADVRYWLFVRGGCGETPTYRRRAVVARARENHMRACYVPGG